MREEIRKTIRKITSALDLNDVFALAGMAFMAAGLFFVYPPASLIVPGALIFWLGVK